MFDIQSDNLLLLNSTKLLPVNTIYEKYLAAIDQIANNNWLNN